jgi:putative transposase
MARRKLIRQSDFPYHINTRTNNKTWFNIPIFEVWDSCKESLVYAQSKKSAVIHCFVLMGNHYHVLITTPDNNIDEFMMFFNMKLSKLINQKSRVINHKFSNRYKWSIIDNEGYLLNAYRYIYQNSLNKRNFKVNPNIIIFHKRILTTPRNLST